jgi:hypothetical protein
MVQLRQENKGGISHPYNNNNTVLILRFTRISEKFYLQMREIAIRLKACQAMFKLLSSQRQTDVAIVPNFNVTT